MAKKSALKELKASLKEKGMLGVKPSKRPKDFKNPAARSNPYELKFTKQKHEILGRKLKGIKGNPSLQRKKTQQVRLKTLLPELINRNKESRFEDKRIGEKSNLSIEDKMFERFVKEQQNKSKGSIFNLEEDELTHGGKSLSQFDDFTYDSENESNKELDFRTVDSTHFGGFDDDEAFTNEDGKKSKTQVMEEVIAKSKFHKYERQKIKEEDLAIIDELDQELDSLRELLMMNPSTKPFVARTKDDDYDKYVHELAMERRGNPSDRLKTEDELLLEEKEKLEKMESQRLARMNAQTDLDNKRNPQADDLGDFEQKSRNNNDPLAYKDGVLVDQDSGSEDQVDESEESGTEDSDEEMDGEEESDMNSDLDESDQEDEMMKDNDSISSEEIKDMPIPEQAEEQAEELPYIFEAPTDYPSLRLLLDDKTPAQADTILSRIRVLHHVKLGGTNRQKLETLHDLLYQDLEAQSSFETPDYINFLHKHLFELSQQFPQKATEYSINRIQAIKTKLSKKPKFFSVNELLFFQHIGFVFSTSDFKHPVVIPALSTMNQCLELTPITCEKDAVTGLYICKIIAQYTKQSKRFCPEATNFLYRVLFLILGPEEYSFKEYPTHPLDKPLSKSDFKSIQPLSLTMITNSEYLNSTQIIIGSLKLLFNQATLQFDSPSFIDLFNPLKRYIEMIPKTLLNQESQIFISQFQKSHSLRFPLKLQTRKPVAIKSYVPKFNERFSVDRKNNDPDRERNEKQKQKRMYSKEFKGAVRELKKDGDFIARQKLEMIKENDQKYKKRIDSIMGQLASQEGAMRGYEREKKKGKK